ncbi:MAG: hypothetical protein D6706_09675 [Chloroflexi bacterium]|nr:MAG: hypothetical protein D6706_09675 [Chloroflexota bacterium]
MSEHTSEIANRFLDTNIPNTARIFNYMLGGSANFEVDRQVAEQILQQMPSLRKWVRLRHAFVQEAAYRLGEEGFGQFLDFGSGIPAEDQIHTTVPNAKVIYSDINPVAVSYGQSLFANMDRVAFIFGDVRQIERILQSSEVKQLIDLQEKVAIGLNALMLFLPPEDLKRIARVLHDWAPKGSKLFVVFQTRQAGSSMAQYENMLEISRMAGFPIRLYTLEEHIELLEPWSVDCLEPIAEFLGLPDDFITKADEEGIGMQFFAAIMCK